jgi:two-component sensor histidine kinase
MVDDSSADRTLCRILLQEEYGAELDFVEASNARRGLELCDTGGPRPDCLLLDYKLPDLTGVEFLRRLDQRHVGHFRALAPRRALSDAPLPADLPEFAVVMLTGLGNEQVAAEAMRAGAQDYLVKDRITSESLRLAIEKATGKVGLLRALQSERDRLARMLAEKETLLSEKEALLAEKESLLAEKDALLQEVQHRVKNNLQVIASLLRLQADHFNDARLSAALRDSQNRVESMALIHEQLYQVGNLREVDLAEHASLLASHLMHAYGANPRAAEPARIQCRLNVQRLPVGVDRAIPSALILNELISNALKHAFPGDRAGVIQLTGGMLPAAPGGTIFLEVRDNGVGLAPSAPSSPSLGLNIVRILTRQLRGTFSIEGSAQKSTGENSSGTVCRLTFPTHGEKQGEHHASDQPQAEPKYLRHTAG